MKGKLGSTTFSMQQTFDEQFDKTRRSFIFSCSNGSALSQKQCQTFYDLDSSQTLVQNAAYYLDVLFFDDNEFQYLFKADLTAEYSCWYAGVAVVSS